MKIAIHQPYLFPYIGYFQLINVVDKFVVFDDVQYIKGGWINRNRILLDGKPHLFTLGIQKGPRNRLINQVSFSKEIEKDKEKLLNKLEYNYKKAPFYKNTLNLVTEILESSETNISLFITNSLKKVCNYLDIQTPFYISSNLEYDRTLKKVQRVIDIIVRMKATQYINTIGGIKLYSKKKFASHGIKLSYIKSGNISYPQFNYPFVPDLSIIDVMMFNPKEKAKEFLSVFRLL